MAIVVVGVLLLVALGVVCLAAYMINAESFEFSTGILRLVSFSIKVRSPGTTRRRRSVRPRPALNDSVRRVSSYKVSVGTTTVRVKNFRDARGVVAEAITNLMARDPESIAHGAMMVNQAFETGAAEHSLTAHGRWSQTVTVDGEPVLLAIIKKRWW